MLTGRTIFFLQIISLEQINSRAILYFKNSIALIREPRLTLILELIMSVLIS